MTVSVQLVKNGQRLTAVHRDKGARGPWLFSTWTVYMRNAPPQVIVTHAHRLAVTLANNPALFRLSQERLLLARRGYELVPDSAVQILDTD